MGVGAGLSPGRWGGGEAGPSLGRWGEGGLCSPMGGGEQGLGFSVGGRVRGPGPPVSGVEGGWGLGSPVVGRLGAVPSSPGVGGGGRLS